MSVHQPITIVFGISKLPSLVEMMTKAGVSSKLLLVVFLMAAMKICKSWTTPSRGSTIAWSKDEKYLKIRTSGSSGKIDIHFRTAEDLQSGGLRVRLDNQYPNNMDYMISWCATDKPLGLPETCLETERVWTIILKGFYSIKLFCNEGLVFSKKIDGSTCDKAIHAQEWKDIWGRTTAGLIVLGEDSLTLEYSLHLFAPEYGR